MLKYDGDDDGYDNDENNDDDEKEDFVFNADALIKK